MGLTSDRLKGGLTAKRLAQPQEPGIIQGIAQSVASPFLKVASSGVALAKSGTNLAQAGVDYLQGDTENLNRNIQEGLGSFGTMNAGYLGKKTPLGYDEQGNKLSFLRGLAQSAGVGLEIGSNVITGGGAATAGKVAFKEALKVGVKEAAKTGAKAGIVYGLGTGLQKEAERPESSIAESSFNVAYDALTSGVLGGITAGALAGTTAVAGATTRRLMEFVHPAFKEKRIASLVDDVANQFRKTLNLNKTQRTIETRSGKDVSKFLAEEGLSLDVKNNKLSADDAIEALEFKADAENGAFQKLLDDSGGYVKFSDIKKAVLRGMKGFGTSIEKELGDAKNEILVLAQQFDNYPKDTAGDILIPVGEANGIKQFYWKNGKFNALATPDEKSKAAMFRRIGSAFKDGIEDAIDDADVGAFNQRLGDLQNAIYMLNDRNGMAVTGGRLGKFFGRTIGAIAGSPGGTFGSITGAITGDKIVDILQNPKITTAFARQYIKMLKEEGKEELAEQVQEILARRASERAVRKVLPAPSWMPMGARQGQSSVSVIPAQKSVGRIPKGQPDAGKFKQTYLSSNQ